MFFSAIRACGARFKRLVLKWLSLALVVWPSFMKIPVYRGVFGYRIGRGVKIGLAWLYVDALEIADHVRIGHFTRIKGIPAVKIGDHTSLGVGNTFTGTLEFTNFQSQMHRQNRPTLSIGRHVGISMFHYFDMQDELTIGDFTTLAGRTTTCFTHYLDVENGTQSSTPVHIGSYCMVGSAVQLVPGAGVPDYCVVGMGAVVTRAFTTSYCVIAGNPATVVRSLSPDCVYFHRERGWIGSYTSPPWE